MRRVPPLVLGRCSMQRMLQPAVSIVLLLCADGRRAGPGCSLMCVCVCVCVCRQAQLSANPARHFAARVAHPINSNRSLLQAATAVAAAATGLQQAPYEQNILGFQGLLDWTVEVYVLLPPILCCWCSCCCKTAAVKFVCGTFFACRQSLLLPSRAGSSMLPHMLLGSPDAMPKPVPAQLLCSAAASGGLCDGAL